jgi:hypothetical protein
MNFSISTATRMNPEAKMHRNSSPMVKDSVLKIL